MPQGGLVTIPAVHAPGNNGLSLIFPSHSHSDRDAREAAAITSQYVCPFSKQLLADMKEDTDGSE